MATAKKKRKPGTPSPAQLRARRKFAAMAKARAKAARAAKRASGIKSKKRPTAKRPAVKKATRKTPRKRNVLSPDRNHPIEVTRHWRKGGASAWQRAEAAGQKRLFAMNPNGKRINLHDLQRQIIKWRSKGMLAWEVDRRLIKMGLTVARAKSERKRAFTVFNQDQRYSARRLPNPSGGISRAKAQRKEFLGSPSRKTLTVYVPKGSKVKGALSAMGKLHRIKVRGRTAFDFSRGNIFLARDGRNRMHVAGKGYRIAAKGKRRNPDGLQDLGVIESIEYVATKSHLDGEPTIYVHKMGEEGGEKPHLLVNDEGLALIDGGDYTITERGIEN